MGFSPRRYNDGHIAANRRDYMREYMRAKRHSASRTTSLPFVGIDGEGGGENGTSHPGYHAYFLLRAGDAVLTPDDGDARLTTSQCLDFLCNLPQGNIYVAYFFDYDVTKMLEDVPFAKLKQLVNRDERKVINGRMQPVWWGDYQIDYLPRKEFKVRRVSTNATENGKRYTFGKWTVVNDVGTFFQCKFVEALEKWGVGTPQQLALIKTGKDMRGNFHIQDMYDIAEYNAMEIVLLQELMEKFRAACAKAGLVPSRWQGPGLLAKAMMKRHDVPRSRELTVFSDDRYSELWTYARNAFYGGRPEISAIGPVDREVYQYDINSAYPSAMLSVPCLVHGDWKYRRGDDTRNGGRNGDSGPSLVYGQFERQFCNSQRYPLWYGLPIRRKEGTICYPGNGAGWYWDFEVRSAIHQRFTVEGAWEYVRNCECQPLAFVHDMYAERIKIGKDQAGIPLKLALNSLYGICAQSIGSPEYANPIWASFITASCRTQIQDFIHSSEYCMDSDRWCGKDILMAATDSVCTWNRRTDIPIGGALGEWSEEIHPRGMFLIQPGLYFGSSGKRAKTRGVPLAAVEAKEQEFREAFDRMVKVGQFEAGNVSVPQRMFVGIRSALQRRNTKLLGQWIDLGNMESGKVGKTISFDWSTKRATFPVINPRKGLHSYIETFPKTGSVDEVSVPYSKDIGGLVAREGERLWVAEQPDWVDVVQPGEMG